jgi:pimeloyl-ACP methyl ester carboxylesterase
VTAAARWFGPDDGPLLGWLSVPEDGWSTTGVLVLPPVGYEYWSTHRTLRTMAERLSEAGHAVLRFDYEGTGDSSGDQWDEDRVAAWRRSVRSAAAELRALGATRLVMVGVRLGGALALLGGAELGADLVVAWKPVAAGRRYAREIRLLSTPVPEEFGVAEGAVVAGGTVFSAQTLADLSAIDVRALEAAPAPRVVLVADDAAGPLAERLEELGAAVEQRPVAGGEAALEQPAEYATVPAEVVGAVVDAVGEGDPAAPRPEAGPARAAMDWHGAAIAEEVVRLGPHGLVGVLTRPANAGDGGAIAVFLNSGSEPHIGPGRAWVEYARGLAAAGHASLRVDFRGWGESPDDGHAPGRPYDAHCLEDTADLVAALGERGEDRVVLVGLCAGAWVALEVVDRVSVAGVVALNPQLYWRPGDPVEATMTETHARRAPDRRREERGRAWGLWTMLDVAGHRPWAGAWLDRLRAADTPILLLFAAGDDGIAYLRTRLGRRLARTLAPGKVRVAEIGEIDHSMHRVWLREAVLDALARELDAPPG